MYEETTVTSAARSSTPLHREPMRRRFWLRGILGLDRTVPIVGIMRLGSSEECDIVIRDANIAPVHVELHASDASVGVRNLGDPTSVRLNGAPIQNAELREGILRVGESVFELQMRAQPPRDDVSYGRLVGRGAIAEVSSRLQVAGAGSQPLLLRGESGSGKTLCARLVHDLSERSGPFLTMHLSTIAPARMEAELFGDADGEGFFRAARGGTLVLDELGWLSAEAQETLLRVLERAPGTTRPGEPMDVRIISTSSTDLTRDRGFSQELLARLSMLDIEIPPLRDRLTDLPRLIRTLLSRAGRGEVRVHPDAIEALSVHPWPMNVRELDVALRSALSRAADHITLHHLPGYISATTQRQGTDDSEQEALKRRRAIEHALREHGGNVLKASKTLGFSRVHVYRLMKEFELDPNSFRTRRGARR